MHRTGKANREKALGVKHCRFIRQIMSKKSKKPTNTISLTYTPTSTVKIRLTCKKQENSMALQRHAAQTSIVCIILVLALAQNCFAAENVLEQYVNAPDDTFAYKLVRTYHDFLHTTYVLEITSQEWFPDDVEPEKWKHWLRIIEPRLLGLLTQNIPFFSLVTSDTALLYLVRGDADHEDAPSGATFEEAELALATRSIVAELHGIPIGPVIFHDEDETSALCLALKEWDPLDEYEDQCTVPRRENSLQARSFDLALETEDFTWALMAPMTKAAVRGMDVIQEFLQQRNWGMQIVSKFVLTGHSKRGHITWLAAALDDRVTAVAPVSYDLLNITDQIALQDTSWPARSPELDANMEFDLYERYKTTVGEQLIADLDPYYYRDRLTVPALIVVGTGDPYSCPDAANLYINELTAPSRISYVPNTGHDIPELAEVESSIAQFYRHIINNQPLPDFTWSGLQQGSFTVTPGSQKPDSVRLWQATNPENRDFRFFDDPAAPQWTPSDIVADANGAYAGTVQRPEAGYTAFYVELIYEDSVQEDSYSFATPLTVLGQ